MLAVVFLHIAFIVLRYVPLALHSLDFCHEDMLDFVTGVSCICWDDRVVFVFKSIYIVYYMYWLTYDEPSRHFSNKANLVIVYNLFDVCLYSVCNFKKHFESIYSWGLLVCSFPLIVTVFIVSVLKWYWLRLGVWACFFCFYCLTRTGCRSLNTWWNSAVTTPDPELITFVFLAGKHFFYYCFNIISCFGSV